MARIYLAGPHGFSEIGAEGAKMIKQILGRAHDVLDPFEDEQNTANGEKIAQIQRNLRSSPESSSYQSIIKELEHLNTKIARRNEELLHSADFLCAILDGPDVDSGTAAEIGLAYGLNKKIYGYRGDFRVSGDNLGSMVNLQVESFIVQSGGQIFTSLAEMDKFFGEFPIKPS